MRKNLILPKNGVVLNLREGERLYFLAGPIRGAGDWQARAIKMLNGIVTQIVTSYALADTTMSTNCINFP